MVAITILSFWGCGESEPQIIIETTQNDFGEESDFLGGMICMDCNLDGCPFTIYDRHMKVTVEDATFACHLLEEGMYDIDFHDISEYKTPPCVDDYPLSAGEEVLVTGHYVPE
jgi:hypothetical protein